MHQSSVKPIIQKSVALFAAFFVVAVLVFGLVEGEWSSQLWTYNEGPLKMEAGLFWGTVFLTAAAYTVALFLFLRRNTPGERLASGHSVQTVPFWAWMAIGFGLRILLGLVSDGYEVDMNCFKAWGFRMADNGPVGFYAEDYFCDYPPAYLYILGIPMGLCNALSIPYNSMLSNLLVKMPSILAEMGIAWILYWQIKGRVKSAPMWVFLFVLINPALLASTVIWGQIDSFLTLFLLLTLLFLTKDNIIAAGLCFSFAVALKPQALLLGPVLLWYAVDYIRQRKAAALRPILLMFAASALLILLLFLPMGVGEPSFWFMDKYFGTMTSYPYMSLNAANFYAMFGMNTVADTLPFLGLPYKLWTTAGVIGAILLSLLVYLKNRKEPGGGGLMLSAAVLIIALFMFGPYMHERYILPGILFLLFAVFDFESMRLAALVGLFSVVQYILVLGVMRVWMFDPHHPVMLAASALNFLALLALVFSALRGRNQSHKENAHGQSNPANA